MFEVRCSASLGGALYWRDFYLEANKFVGFVLLGFFWLLLFGDFCFGFVLF